MGVFLESYLEEHGAFSGDVEVLHLGIMSWNIVSECAYLRRQLSLLQPDPDDGHWNRVGMEKVAKVLYGALPEHGYLSALGLEEWPEAYAVHAEMQEQVRGAYDDDKHTEGRLKLIDAALSCNPLTAHDAEQVYTGLDKDGLVAPYAAFSLRSEGAERQHLKGQALDRPEMNGATVTAMIDGQPTGNLEIQAGQPIDVSWTVSDEVRSRTFVSVYLVADDWVYVGDDLQQCLVFRLGSVGFE